MSHVVKQQRFCYACFVEEFVEGGEESAGVSVFV
jgi:hypothetical protein